MFLIMETENGVAIRNFADKDTEIDKDAEVAKWEARTGRTVVSSKVSDTDPRPTDRHFRDAWKGLTVDVDMTEARKLHMTEIRKMRNIKLKELDGHQYREGHDTERQALRDIPQTIDLSTAKTPEALKELMPTELK